MNKKRINRNRMVGGALIASIILLYLPTLQYLFLQSRFPYDGWDCIVPWVAIAIALFSHYKAKAAGFRLRPSPRGIWLIAVALVLQAVGLLGVAKYTYQICSLIIMLAGILVFMGGQPYFAYFSFALFVLLFKLPWGQYLFDWFGVESITTAYNQLIQFLLGTHQMLDITPRYTGWHTLDLKVLMGLCFIYISKKDFHQKLIRSLALIPAITLINIVRVWTLFLAWGAFVPAYDVTFIHNISNVVHKLILLGLFAWLALV